MHIVVIGSGFGGISVALRCLSAGHDVTLIEKLDKPGGRAYFFENNGFVFDAGPTVITAPWLFDELFELFGKKTSDYFKLVKLDTFYKILFDDGKSFTYNGVKSDILNEIKKFNPDDVEGYLKFFSKTEKIFKAGFDLIAHPFGKFTDMLKILPNLIFLRSDKSVYKYVSGFIKNDYLRKVFSFHTLLIGGNPYNTTSIYTLIHYLEQKWGVWYVKGGTNQAVSGLIRLFLENKGKLLLGSEVTEILTNDSKKPAVKGVRMKNGDVIEADAVISNADVAFTYKYYLKSSVRKKYTDKKIDSMKYSMSLFVLYFGTKVKYDNMPHHSIILGKTYKELLTDIFKNYKLSDDFSLYLHRPTASDDSVAPPGNDCYYVLSPVPNLKSGTDWKKEGERYKNLILDYLEEKYMPGLKSNIVNEFFVTPDYFLNKLNSYLGTAFAVEPLLMQSAWMRPHNESEDIENLYFVGAGTHPGAGLPGVISSAKIVEKLIKDKS